MINPIQKSSESQTYLSPEQEKLFYLVTSKYITTKSFSNSNTYRVISNTCADLDSDLRKIEDELIKYNAEGNQLKIDFLMFAQKLIYTKFLDFDCRNRIEQTRLETAGNLTTQAAIKAEQSILTSNNKESNIYIIIGSVILLTGLVIILTAKK